MLSFKHCTDCSRPHRLCYFLDVVEKKIDICNLVLWIRNTLGMNDICYPAKSSAPRIFHISSPLHSPLSVNDA